ncbi:putative photosynthetic complex assembly protein [Cognatiyoonia koreensis]|uniref:Putative photosynthetic complex assembly protein n=1 Tax=Cognatiyoonia koreensis TaxID=364200 RepID=A0A1I0RR27_9RHOB|nr:photosynthetic complex assembly protein PuhC [Cognatiyoonia koreensis]SEW43754.1 putative photosynthetic complex assembly protein [Cognatiyoonia koreensis]
MSNLEQQMRHRDKEMVPTFLVKGMFGLMIATTALVAYAQWMDVPNRGVLIEAPVAQSVEVTLSGNRNGLYEVRDASGALLVTSADDRMGFIGVMGRAVDREREVRGITETAPISVIRRENGHIAVLDEASGLSVELIGYGKDNVAAFAQLLDQ